MATTINKAIRISLFVLLLGFITGCGSRVESPQASIGHENAPAVQSENSNLPLASLQNQVELLQKAIIPQTAEESVELWAKGVKTRNGALQFAVMSPELRNKQRSFFESDMWVTGTSSPWIKKFKIISKEQNTSNIKEYQVVFTLVTSTGEAGTETYLVRAQHIGGDWYISEITKQK